MTKPIIRLEVQATPTIDMFGVEQYAWRVYQITDGYEINLVSGMAKSLALAYSLSFNGLKPFI